jgi:pSer/pThr/pTyr-binding forkhead associated (FHA) protein
VAHPTFADPGEEESEEQTTVDPEIFKSPRSLPREPARVQSGEADIDQKSTTTEAMSTESNDLFLEPSVDVAAEFLEPYPGAPAQDDGHLASGTGETGGASVDEPTRDESVFQPAVNAARDLPAARPPTRAPAPPEPELSPAWLVVQSGSDRGRRFALRGGRTTVGRGMDNDVVLTDIAVSRHHLTIEASGNQHVLHDLGSGNGTLVNDRDEDGAFRLSHGDKLELGNTVLVFECTAAELPHALGKFHAPGDDEELSTVAGHRVARSAPSAPTFAPAPPPMPPAAPPPAAHAPHAIAAQVTGPIDRMPASRRTLGPGQLGAIGAPPPPPPNLPPRARVASAPPNPGPVRTRRSASMAVQQARRSASMAAQMPSGPIAQRSDSLSAMVSGAPAGPSAAFPFGGPASNLGMGPPGAPGQASGLRPALGYPPMSGGFGSMSPSPLSSPRFQYPNGVMSPMPATDRRRVLISILAIAFVAVGAGIVMALVHGGGKETAPRTAANAAPLPTATQVATATAPTADLLGARELRPVDFGTDEQFLAETAPAAATDARPQGAAVAVETAVADVEAGKSGDPVTSPGRADQDARTGEQTGKTRDSRRDRRRSRADTDAIVEGTGPDLPTLDDANAAVGTGSDAETALRQADGLYRQKRFSDAAALLRKAADSAGKRDVGRLRSLAASYAKIGALLDEGQASLVSDAPRALQAFKSALRLDEEFGDGVHDRTIGARIAQAAPAAAGAYMARKDYPEAKAAADIAEKFGAGDSDRVRIVRGSLERKAEELYEEARAAAEAGDDAKAAETARVILRMVPRSSEVYAQANKLAGS